MSSSSDYQQEWSAIHERRMNAFGTDVDKKQDEELLKSVAKRPRQLVGLGLSGGGIRSAFYNLGFLQALSHRGFLRYVDYLCSVSGGGYIAGFLTSHAAHSSAENSEAGSDSPKGFHADKSSENQQSDDRSDSPWHLGRNPSTGRIDPSCLPGIGAYLSRTSLFALSFCVSLFIRILFYVGIVGLAATCVAMFYRTFDDPMFRALCDTVLDMNYGNELAKAFIPSMLIGLLLLISTLGLLAPHPDQLRHQASSSPGQGAGTGKPMLRQRFCAAVRGAPASLMWIFCLSLMCGAAIFLGNDITAVRARSGNQFFLNHYAQYIFLFAALSQLIAFLGRDRLFKSERNEKSHLPGMFQTMATASVVIFGFLAMVHIMGRENISNYTEHRDPHLVRGDVLSWRGLTELAASITQEPREDVPEVRDYVSAQLRLESEWSQNTHSIFGDDQRLREVRASDPPSPFETTSNIRENASFAHRIWFLPQAYLYPMNHRFAGDTIKDEAEKIKNIWTTQSTFLTSFNNQLESWQTFLFLCQFVPDAPQKFNSNATATSTATKPPVDDDVASPSSKGNVTDSPKPDHDVLKSLHKWVKSNSDWLPENERRTLTDQIAVMTNERLSARTKEQINTTNSLHYTDRVRVATANRILLERYFPGIVQPRHLASTHIVPPHDQATRRTWLVTWMILAAVGTLLGCISKLNSAPRHFYRTQLNKHFLSWQGDTMLTDLNPQVAGLPLPIFLAARMRRVMHRGRSYVDQQPHAFTTTPNGHDTQFADAIALSGAAVTPLMSGNIWLSLLLDFFGTGLGGWPESGDRNRSRISDWPMRNWRWIVGPAAAVAMIYLSFTNWAVAPILAVLCALTSFAAFLLPFYYHEVSFFKLLNPLLSPPTLNPSESGKEKAKQQDVEAHDNTSQSDRRQAYIADGGYYDYLGVTELLQRRCELMVVSDAGAHLNQDSFATLARICETARSELGVQFFDLDHEAPIDFRRLRQDKTEKGLVHQTFLALRVRYPETENPDELIPREGLLFYCQMGITDTDPVEILQIRNRFPSFPDEPTSNQFYTEEQVAAYRNLGYHIGKGLCSELHRWDDRLFALPKDDSSAQPSSNDSKSMRPKLHEQRLQSFCLRLESSVLGQYNPVAAKQPGLSIVKHRLLTAYRLACHREEFYKKDDVREEAIWPVPEFRFPSLRHECEVLIRLSDRISVSQNAEYRVEQEQIVDRWLSMYESNADIRAAFRAAVLEDVNMLDSSADSWCRTLFTRCFLPHVDLTKPFPSLFTVALDVRAAAFLAGIAVASHEIHSGRPHETFQVGGREKLVSLCLDLAQQVTGWLLFHDVDVPKTDPQLPVEAIEVILPPGASQVKHNPKQLIAMVIGEVMELTSQIFFRFEHRTVASFSTCLITSIAAMNMRPSDHPEKRKRTESDNNVQLLTAQARILRSLRRNNARALSEALLSLYQLSSTRRNDDKPTIPRPAPAAEPLNSTGLISSP